MRHPPRLEPPPPLRSSGTPVHVLSGGAAVLDPTLTNGRCARRPGRATAIRFRVRLSLYVHVPFCTSPCFYCGCNRIITRDRSRAGPYLAALYREIDLTAALFDRDREVIQLHFGGGTPNFLSTAELRDAVETFQRHFHFRDRERDLSIELDPRTVKAGDVVELAAIGFTRASLGVQDFDPAVQSAVNRVQTVDETIAIIDACRRHGFRSVNIDLIYGLPEQTREGFAATLDTVIAARPDRLAVYGYAHLPQLFPAQRRISRMSVPGPEAKLNLLQLAIEKLEGAGYVYIGMDHFALPDDELAMAQARGSLHRNFMGYTTHADTDLVGVGVSAISHIGATLQPEPARPHGMAGGDRRWSAAGVPRHAPLRRRPTARRRHSEPHVRGGAPAELVRASLRNHLPRPISAKRSPGSRP